MQDIPKDINLEALSGPTRGETPALYFRDEAVWSPSRKHIAVAYTIIETSMGNEIGFILWASVGSETTQIIENPHHLLACCWQSPWCRWIDDETFVFKAQKYNNNTNAIYTPLVVIHIVKGFQVLAGTNSTDQWIDKLPPIGDDWIPFDTTTLLQMIERTT